jgi:hypothetical protein
MARVFAASKFGMGGGAEVMIPLNPGPFEYSFRPEILGFAGYRVVLRSLQN